MLTQPGNAVNIPLNDHRVECWQKLRRYEILVTDYVYLFIIGIKPIWQLPIGYEMNFAYPWSVLIHPTKPILQKSMFPKPSLGSPVFGIFTFIAIFVELSLPHRVIHVNPCNYKIDFHIFV